MKPYKSLPLALLVTFALGLSGLIISRAQASGSMARWTQQIATHVRGWRNTTTPTAGRGFAAMQTATEGQLIISEFRLRGPNGANDEFIEIHNNSGVDHTVMAASGTGYGIAASNGVTRCSIPNGTVIPNHGHYLCVNSVGYSLAAYPSGIGTTATGDATYTTDIPDNAGIAIFNNNTGGASYSLANRLDAVGSTSEANALYKEGAGYPALTPFSIDYSFYRKVPGITGGITGTAIATGKDPQDTDNNAADFLFVDTNGTSAGAGQRLGAPGPQNLSSPLPLGVQQRALLDPCTTATSPPNKVRDFTSDPANNSTFGTIDLRRTFTNNTGGQLTRLRFRIQDLTTFPAPSGVADLRPRTSTAVVVTVDRAPCGSGTSNVTVAGTTLEQPPSQPNGGGFNSSWSVGTVTLATPLANGASVDVRFLFGIQQTGFYRLAIAMEGAPAAGGLWVLCGNTDSSSDVEGGCIASSVNVTGTGGDDTLAVTATGANSGSYSLNGGAAVAFSGIASFAFDGMGGNDTLRINNPSVGLFAPSGGIDYNGGGQPGDALNLLGGTAATEIYFVGTTTPPIGAGPGNTGNGLIRFTGPNLDIRFTGLAPIVDTVAATSLTVNATDAANTISITNGGVAPRLNVAVDAFEPIDFDNKTAVIINGGDGVGGGDVADTISVNYTNTPAALASITINGDEGADAISVQSTRLSTTVNGGDGIDVVNVGNTGTIGSPGLLTPIAGAVIVDGQTGGASLTVDGSGASVTADYAITSTTVTRSVPAGFGGVTSYSNLASLLLATGSGANIISVNSTAAGVLTNITTGAGNDTFTLANGVSLNGGTVDGGADTDTLDYNAFTTPVSVNLGLNATGLGGTIDGTQENPPQTVTNASGTVAITNYNPVTKTFDISATVSNLAPANVTGYHIHRAPVGTNGAIIIDLAALFGLGVLVPSGTGFTFTATGVTLPAQHEAAFLGGITYFNVHTAAAPGGLIRGQIFSNGNANLASGTATGIASVTNVENAIGGSGADSLVGSFGVNNLTGNAGNDTIVGGPGNDTMNGGDNNDVLVWSNGDNNDVLDGNLGADVVQVNGSVLGGDTFTVGANGTRAAFARTNLVPFSLDIGTTETLVVNGPGGDDTFTVNSLVGVADLSVLSLFGFDGADTFNLTPIPNGTTLTLNVNGGAPATASGDTLDIIGTGVANPLLTLTSGNGTFTSTSHQTINLTSIENTSAPTANVTAANIATGGATTYTFTVTYTGDTAINVGTLGTGDMSINGPGGFSTTPAFVSVDTNSNGTPRTATYSFTPPGGSWDSSDNGTYNIVMQTNQVADNLGNSVVAGTLGSFTVNVAGSLTFIVTNLNDAGAGSLRQAILNANANSFADTINLQAGVIGTITLTGGELTITDNVTINGPGANLLTVSGNNVSRVFNINASYAATISGLTITGGKTASNESGGGITNAGTLNLSNCLVFGNTASGNGGGGGIYSTDNLSVTDSTIRNNTSNGGGGILAFGGSVNVSGSTINANTCNFDGGGLNLLNANANLTNSTISGNQANATGGGVMFFSTGGSFTLAVSSCTIVNNTGGSGGGIRTFTQNGAGNTATTTVRNTIIANNTAPNLATGTSGGGAVAITSLGFNLTSDISPLFLNQATDQLNTNPLLGPLQNNFGPTFTHALLPGSPALDKGHSFALVTDQRGGKRPADDLLLPNSAGGDGADIGAFERTPMAVVDAAYFRQGVPLAQESAVSAFGENFATGVGVSTSIPLATTLVNTSVIVRDAQNIDRLAPLYYVGPTQINFQIPPGTAIGAATISVQNNGTTVYSTATTIAAVQPSLFSATSNGAGYPAGYITRVKPGNVQIFEPVALSQNGAVVPVPIDLSNQQDILILVLYGTGIRKRSSDAGVTINIGGTLIGVGYSNEAPGYVGLDQINSLPLPASLAGSGQVNMTVTVDGKATNTLLLNFK